MAKYLTEADREFRKLVEAFDGEQAPIADYLGIDHRSVSKRLTTEKHGAWWRGFKGKRAKRRKAAAQRRYRARARARALRSHGCEPVE